MTLIQEYINRHKLEINPADYGFDKDLEFVEPETSVRVVRSEITPDSLWSFFIHHHNLENWTRRETYRNGIANSLTKEQRLVFQAFPYLSSIWDTWQANAPDFFRIIRRF